MARWISRAVCRCVCSSGAVVRDSIIMPGARIEEGAVVQYAIVAENSVVGANSVVGQRPEEMENKEDWGVAVIGPAANCRRIPWFPQGHGRC